MTDGDYVETIQQKLDHFFEEIQRADFLKMRGLGNEVPYFVFDYHPQYELIVRNSTPIIIFYPGEYSGQGLRLFNRFESTGYYRAFSI